MVRAIVLRGATLDDLWPDLLWLVGFTIVGVIAAAMRFKKRLD
jgi:ABC-2 type transport system permease protein